MKEYTAKQIKQLEKNPYVFKVTKHMIYYTAKFKEDFWVSYQAGNTPRKILEDFGFDLTALASIYSPDIILKFGKVKITLTGEVGSVGGSIIVDPSSGEYSIKGSYIWGLGISISID